MVADLSDLLTTGAAARMIGISCDTLRAWVRVGKLAASRLDSGQLLLKRADVERARDERERARSSAA